MVHAVYEVKELLDARLCGAALAVNPIRALIQHLMQFAALESVATLFINLLTWIHYLLLLLLQAARMGHYTSAFRWPQRPLLFVG